MSIAAPVSSNSDNTEETNCHGHHGSGLNQCHGAVNDGKGVSYGHYGDGASGTPGTKTIGN